MGIFKGEYSKRKSEDIWGDMKSRRVWVLKTNCSEETLTKWSLFKVYAQILEHVFSFNILYQYRKQSVPDHSVSKYHY